MSKKLTKRQRRQQAQKTELVRNIILGVLAIVFGLLFVFAATDNDTVAREEARTYSGTFQCVEQGKNLYGLRFADGELYELYPHTVERELDDTLQALPSGTTLHLLINPNNGCVAEIRTDTEELLNFETSQQAVEKYDNGYFWIGGFAMLAGVVLLILAPLLYIHHGKAEKKRWQVRATPNVTTTDTPPLRVADMGCKCRVLAEITHAGYRICYRRTGRVNELVINDRVYDEHKALIEFEHVLAATVDGHEIEVGLDADSRSYITFDGRRIADKPRLI